MPLISKDRALPLDDGGQGQPGHEELQQARPPRFLNHLERQALSWLEKWGIPELLKSKSSSFPSQWQTIPSSTGFACNLDSVQLMLCHLIEGSTLDWMWSWIIRPMDAVDLQFIGSNFTFINKVNRCLASYSPRATTTNQTSNRVPNEPLRPGTRWPKIPILVVFGQKSKFLLEKAQVLVPT